MNECVIHVCIILYFAYNKQILSLVLISFAEVFMSVNFLLVFCTITIL